MKIPLVLALDDHAYANRMADWMLVHPECGFRPVIPDESMRPARGPGVWEDRICLVSPSCMEEVKHACPNMHCLCLQEDAMPETASQSRFDGIFKYQPLPDLFHEVRAVSTECGWIREGQMREEEIAVTLVLHLSGATHLHPVAPALSMVQASTRKVLYLNIDPAGHTETWFRATGGHGLSRLAYHVRNIREGWEERFLNCLFLDVASGVYAVRDPDLPEDAADMGAVELAEVRRAASRSGFGSIVLDAGLGLDRRNLSLMSVADRIFLVTGKDAPGIASAAAANRILNGKSNRRVPDAANVGWILCGKGRPAGVPSFAEGQPVSCLPEAYPAGFPREGLAMDPSFLSCISALVPILPCDGWEEVRG